MHVDSYVRIANAHVRTVASLVTPIVGYRILHTVCHKLGMAEVVTKDYRLYKESVVHIHVL